MSENKVCFPPGPRRKIILKTNNLRWIIKEGILLVYVLAKALVRSSLVFIYDLFFNRVLRQALHNHAGYISLSMPVFCLTWK